jgi:hypothetical protein
MMGQTAFFPLVVARSLLGAGWPKAFLVPHTSGQHKWASRGKPNPWIHYSLKPKLLAAFVESQVAKDEEGASIKHLGEVVRMLGLDVASNQT